MASRKLNVLASFTGLREEQGFPTLSGLVKDAAGNLYGTNAGGTDGFAGSIFSYSASTQSLSTVASFSNSDGRFPQGALTPDDSGNLYGTTASGKTQAAGVIFRFTPSSATITTLGTLGDANLSSPSGKLLRDGGGNLYGTASQGGDFGFGGVFEYNAASQKVISLASFDGSNGLRPEGGLARDSAGNFYGTTLGGGADGVGIVFRLDGVTHALSTIASLDSIGDGADGVIVDAAGNIFGTTAGGGSHNLGSVFEIAAGSNTLNTLASFDGTNGFLPAGGLVLDQSGNLFGTTALGGPDVIVNSDGSLSNDGPNAVGTIFEISVPEPNSTFVGVCMALGMVLIRRRRAGVAGLNLMRVASLARRETKTQQPGSWGGHFRRDRRRTLAKTSVLSAGGLFLACISTARAQYTFKTLASFNGSIGDEPATGVIIGPDGNLYGTAVDVTAQGSLFQYDVSSGSLNGLASFSTSPLGSHLTNVSGLVADANGNLFGAIYSDVRTSALGSVFEYTPADGRVGVVGMFSASGATGYFPLTGLTASVNGKFYGLAQFGQVPGPQSEVFQFSPASGAVNGVADTVNGLVPYLSGKLVARGGELYGVTQLGGALGKGSVFQFDSMNYEITTIASFDGVNGETPVGSLALDPAGNLYGMTQSGGAGHGTVFEVDHRTGEIKVLASLDTLGGQENFVQGIVVDSRGNVFGTTREGGAYGCGSIFEIDAINGISTTAFSFNGINGQFPEGDLVIDGDDNIYGTTLRGGPDVVINPDGTFGDIGQNVRGTIFELSVPEPDVLSVLVASGVIGLRRRRRRIVGRVNMIVRK
jgi:uncharacterized repeat protein (TIGR03803 family)